MTGLQDRVSVRTADITHQEPRIPKAGCDVGTRAGQCVCGMRRSLDTHIYTYGIPMWADTCTHFAGLNSSS